MPKKPASAIGTDFAQAKYDPLPGQRELPLGKYLPAKPIGGVQAAIDDLAADRGRGLAAEELADALGLPEQPAQALPPVTAEEIDLLLDADLDRSAAPNTSITGPGSSQTTPGAVDWLAVRLAVGWSFGFADLTARLLAGQRAAQAGGDGLAMLADRSVVAVRQAGARDGITWFAFAFEWRGATILVADQPQPHDTLPNVVVRITGEACLAHGARELWHGVRELIERNGGEIVRDGVERLDVCIDMPDQSVDPFAHARRELRHVCKHPDHDECMKKDEYTGIYFGGGNVLCRIYDKARELKDNAQKRALMIARRWGKDCEVATRVEFQLKREALREQLGTTSVEDVLTCLDSIAEWCVETWLRITDVKPDRVNKHQGRAKPSALWREVVKQFAAAFPDGSPLPEPAAPISPSPERLIKQAMGCLTSAFARAFEKMQDDADMVGALMSMLATRAGELRDDVRRKRALILARDPIPSVLDPLPLPR